MDSTKKIVFYIIITLFTIPAIWSLFGDGFFPMHDDTQPTRVFEMATAFAQGQFPVRWVENLGYGYGYPLYNFYAPLPYYIGAVIFLSGVNVIASTKIMFIAGFLLASYSMFMLVKEITERKDIAVLSSVLYAYAPYHAVQLYVRGAVGELWAYAFLPIVGFGVMLLNKQKNHGLIIGGIGIASVVISHNISALISMGFLFLHVIWLMMRKEFFLARNITLMILFGLGLSAFFWLPAISEVGYTQAQTLIQGSNNFRQHFVFIDQLWSSPWGFAGSGQERADGMSFILGKVHIVLLLVSLIAGSIALLKKRLKYHTIFYSVVLGFVVSIFMLLEISQYFWEIFPYAAYIQYPWRFLMFANYFLSIAIGIGISILISKIHQKKAYILVLIICIVVIGKNVSYFKPQYTYIVQDQVYTEREKIQWDISRISDEYVPLNFIKPESFGDISREKIQANDGIIITEIENRSTLLKMHVSASSMAEIIVSTAFFPGWNVTIDTQKVKIDPKVGLIQFNIPEGEHTVTVFFKNTFIRTIANWISLISLIVFVTMLIARFQNKKPYEKK